MQRLVAYLLSSVGRKKMMGVTGLGLCGFVLAHMLGNMLFLVGPYAYNFYGHTLINSPILYPAEVGLVGLFLLHMILGVILAIENWRARPVGYHMSIKGDQQAPLAARTMIYTGVVALVFLVLHLITFKYGTLYTVTYEGVAMRDLHRLMVEVFSKPAYVIWYLISMVVLWFHLAHAFASSFQSLGLDWPVGRQPLMNVAYLFSTVVAGGFFLQPLYAFFVTGGAPW